MSQTAPDSWHADISVARLRVGVVLFVIWWLPLYLMVPAVSLVASGTDYSTRNILFGVIVFQSVVGLIGLALVGKQTAVLLKRIKAKQLPAVMWRIVWTGKVILPPSTARHSGLEGVK